MRVRSKLLAIALVVGSVGAAAWSNAPGAGASAPRPIGRAIFDPPIARSATERAALAKIGAAGTTVPQFAYTVTTGGHTYKGKIVGKDPTVHQATPATTIKTELIPVSIQFGSGGPVNDPTVANTCDATSALTRTQKSPIFVKQTYSSGGLPLGTGQYVDIVERAQYYKYTKPSGINPGYHVTLSVTTLPKQSVLATGSAEHVYGAVCGHVLGGIDFTTWRNYVKSTLIPSLASKGVGSTTFPLFLFENTVLFQGNPNSCCILGYHDSFINSAGHQQTYGVAMYDNSNQFTGVADVSALSHEVSEWLNDPSGVNPTPAWGNIGQVNGCQSNFETGDPLSGHVLTDTLNAKTYHVQELAYFAWFYHLSPSPSLHGTYSFQGAGNGRFTGFAKACPPGGTN
jgi:hypothetical protein